MWTWSPLPLSFSACSFFLPPDGHIADLSTHKLTRPGDPTQVILLPVRAPTQVTHFSAPTPENGTTRGLVSGRSSGNGHACVPHARKHRQAGPVRFRTRRRELYRGPPRHPAPAPRRASAREAVLRACRWYVLYLRLDADIRADQSTCLLVSGEHVFVPPSDGDQRGPCPGLNALANHNYINHNGVATVRVLPLIHHCRL